jgi:ABC-type nitrate/sulfonate/bicarbonate transport system ATPase subunit
LLKAIASIGNAGWSGDRATRCHLRVGFMFQKPLLLPWRTTLITYSLPVEIQLGSVVDARTGAGPI